MAIFLNSQRKAKISYLQASLYEVNNAIALAKKDISYVTETSNTSQERTAQIHDELTKLHEKQNFLIDEFRKTKEEQTKYVDRLKVNREKLQKEEAHFHEAQGLRNEAYDNLERIRKEHTSTTANTAKNQANLESFKKEKNSLINFNSY